MLNPRRVPFRPAYARIRRCALVCSTLLLALGCDRNIEPYQPGEEAREPDLARIFPAPAEDGPGAGAEGARPAGSGQTTRGAVPPSRAEAGAGASGAPAVAAATGGPSSGEPIRGEIRLGDGMAASAARGGILFVIARPMGARGGPPLAVVRIADPSFPMPFEIGPQNVMIPSMQFAGSISLSARLDADGNAMTRSAADISSPVIEPLAPGATGVDLILSEQG